MHNHTKLFLLASIFCYLILDPSLIWCDPDGTLPTSAYNTFKNIASNFSGKFSFQGGSILKVEGAIETTTSQTAKLLKNIADMCTESIPTGLSPEQAEASKASCTTKAYKLAQSLEK